LKIVQFDQQTAGPASCGTKATRIWLRDDSDFLKEKSHSATRRTARSSSVWAAYSTSVFQLTTFQGVRYTLFAYNKYVHRAALPTSTHNGP